MANFKFFTFDASEIIPGPQFGDGWPCGLGYVGRDLQPGATVYYDYGLQQYSFIDTYLTFNTSFFGAGSVPPGDYDMFAVYAEQGGNLLDEDKWAGITIYPGNAMTFTGNNGGSLYLTLQEMCDSWMMKNLISQNLYCNVLQAKNLNPKSYSIASIKNFNKIADI